MPDRHACFFSRTAGSKSSRAPTGEVCVAVPACWRLGFSAGLRSFVQIGDEAAVNAGGGVGQDDGRGGDLTVGQSLPLATCFSANSATWSGSAGGCRMRGRTSRASCLGQRTLVYEGRRPGGYVVPSPTSHF